MQVDSYLIKEVSAFIWKRVYLAVPDLTCRHMWFPCSLQHAGFSVVACGTWFPDQGLNPSLGIRAQSLSHWAREAPRHCKTISNTCAEIFRDYPVTSTSKMNPAVPHEDGWLWCGTLLWKGYSFVSTLGRPSRGCCSRGSASRCGCSAESVRFWPGSVDFYKMGKMGHIRVARSFS